MLLSLSDDSTNNTWPQETQLRPQYSNYTSDLQKSRHLQKSRVTERHNRGTKRKLKSHPPPQKRRAAPFFALGATSIT